MDVIGEKVVFDLKKNNNDENKQNSCQNTVPIYTTLNYIIIFIKYLILNHQILANDFRMTLINIITKLLYKYQLNAKIIDIHRYPNFLSIQKHTFIIKMEIVLILKLK